MATSSAASIKRQGGLASALRGWRMAWARLHHGLGWPGCLGLCLLACALALAGQVWRVAGQLQPAGSLEPAPVVAPSWVAPMPLVAPSLPSRSEVPALMAQVAASAQAQGLAWPQADYRLAPLTADQLGTLEIGFVLKGDYPALRKFLNQLLDQMPALAVRDFTLRRAHSDVAEVEARFTLVVFLRDGWAGAEGAAAPAAASASAPGLSPSRGAP